MLTAEGQRKKQKLATASNEALLDALRPLVEKIPKTVSDRVKSTGSGAEGSFSTPYSSSWSRKRSQRGRQTSKKDFSYSDSMWASFVIVDEKASLEGVSFRLAPTGTNEDSRKANYYIAQAHNDRENQNIVEMTQDEVDQFSREAAEVIAKYLQNVLR